LSPPGGERASYRFFEFFTANIRNPHTRRAYGRSIAEFIAWCERHGPAAIISVEPLHVGTYLEAATCATARRPPSRNWRRSACSLIGR